MKRRDACVLPSALSFSMPSPPGFSLAAQPGPTAVLQGALITPKVTPRAAITDSKAFGVLLECIASYDGQPTTRTALLLMAYLFPRPGELRQAEWQEFDFDKAIWSILPERMKMRRAHRSPLSKQAIRLLKDLRRITGNGTLIFVMAHWRCWYEHSH